MYQLKLLRKTVQLSIQPYFLVSDILHWISIQKSPDMDQIFSPKIKKKEKKRVVAISSPNKSNC